MRGILLAGLCAIAPMESYAQNITGNDLLEACDAGPNSLPSAFCLGYVVGLTEGMMWGAGSLLLTGGKSAAEADTTARTLLDYCPPPEANVRQFVDIIVAHLKAHPDERHNSARVQAHTALSAAFSCQ